MKRILAAVLIMYGLLGFVSAQAAAVNVTPAFSTVTTDPSAWFNLNPTLPSPTFAVGSYQGQQNVLGLTPSDVAGGTYTYMGAQGIATQVSSAANSYISFRMYIPLSWESSANGNRQAGADWVAAGDNVAVGFSNTLTGTGSFFVADFGKSQSFFAVSGNPLYGAWNTFSYFGATGAVDINKATAYTSAPIGQGGTIAYFDYSPDGTGAYTAHFAVSAVPVPAAVWLFGSGLIGLVGVARRKAA